MHCKHWDKETKECTNGCTKHTDVFQCCIHCKHKDACCDDYSICRIALDMILERTERKAYR